MTAGGRDLQRRVDELANQVSQLVDVVLRLAEQSGGPAAARPRPVESEPIRPLPPRGPVPDWLQRLRDAEPDLLDNCPLPDDTLEIRLQKLRWLKEWQARSEHRFRKRAEYALRPGTGDVDGHEQARPQVGGAVL